MQGKMSWLFQLLQHAPLKTQLDSEQATKGSILQVLNRAAHSAQLYVSHMRIPTSYSETFSENDGNPASLMQPELCSPVAPAL